MSQCFNVHVVTESQESHMMSKIRPTLSINMILCRKKRDYIYFTSEMLRKKDRTEELQISFTSQMVVTEQFWDYGFMAYIAETGGFVGLFLGWSLLQTEQIIVSCLNHRYLKYLDQMSG